VRHRNTQSRPFLREARTWIERRDVPSGISSIALPAKGVHARPSRRWARNIVACSNVQMPNRGQTHGNELRVALRAARRRILLDRLIYQGGFSITTT
jgi:hypothetical protein